RGPPRRDVPDLDGPVPAGRGQPLAVAAEGHTSDAARVLGPQGGQLLARRPVPGADGTVPATRGEVPAVGAERHTEDWPVMVLEDLDFLARRRLPDPHHEIVARRGDVPAVRAECQAEDPLAVTRER